MLQLQLEDTVEVGVRPLAATPSQPVALGGRPLPRHMGGDEATANSMIFGGGYAHNAIQSSLK